MSDNPRWKYPARRKAIVRTIRANHPRCWICGRPIDYSLKYPDPWSFVVDEVVPISHGGSPYELSNCKPAHRWCNGIKSTHSVNWARAEIARRARLKGPHARPMAREQEVNIPIGKW